MNLLSSEILKIRGDFLSAIRRFFEKNGFLEIDTPCLLEIPGMEPYLDPFLVKAPKSQEGGYLITSPEYSLKQALSMGLEKVYEIAHAFRSGEKGGIHTKEFLMLEFYQTEINELELMDVCIEFFYFLNSEFRDFGFDKNNCQKVKVEDLFITNTGSSFSKSELLQTIQNKMDYDPKTINNFYYDDLFFLVFLNFIEPHLDKGPIFVYDYPEELASLAKVENNRAKRFEIYWNRVELGNAFFENISQEVQVDRFKEEQNRRKELGKEVFPINRDFLLTLERGLPVSSGISIGLDRLLMIILGHNDLRHLSPYWGRK
ncbi:MAG: elongation factor P--(R)-beta-lysine ligase [Leptospiraceae bacterium]|nr:elongation factor P--(R)-beta-lysine ligase [Leptospiraceae bacterium]MCP5496718.1 elongation factor P--(R)-beta-lysine ligase [Leptospiraceae bacterium]